MGTPDFAVPSLQALLDTSRLELVGVVTQPDRQKGRGKRVQPPPVKELALRHSVDVVQPERIRGRTFRHWLADKAPELIVVTAYGKILPASVLEAPRYGCLNVHASLLPAYRGAAPIQWALINGEHETGVSIMKMDEGMDTGGVIAVRAIPISDDDTAATLHDKLAQLGADCLRETLPAWLAGSLEVVEQDHERATMAPMLSRDDGQLDWSRSAKALNDQIRGVTPWPGARTSLAGHYVKLFPGRVIAPPPREGRPGEIVACDDTLIVATGDGALEVLEIQLEGRRRMRVDEFMRGFPLEVGQLFGHDEAE
ncbi:MAG: methionyl-tRNA formyltransferase [Myxococcales bacterium]|nr:methionyl-tRNA formyltransferase [Myxococcales bacterium]